MGRLDFAHPTFNAWLGAGLVVANGVLFYLYFILGASENDELFLVPMLVTFLMVQLFLLARPRGGPLRTLFSVCFGIGVALTLLLWVGYLFLLAFASGFRN